MFAFHRPRTYRSALGCCICGAKSSSSRFTDSARYEEDFERCFKIKEERAGEICNACVLLIKRWKKLPPGSNRNWNHVVDARAGPGNKNCRNKNGKTRVEVEVFKKIRKKKKKVIKPKIDKQDPDPFEMMFGRGNSSSGLFPKGIRTRSMVPPSPSPSNSSEEYADDDELVEGSAGKAQHSSFIDLRYWTETKVCCGTVFKGQRGELMIDVGFYKPCSQCTRKQNDSPPSLQQEISNDMDYTSSYDMNTNDSPTYFRQSSNEHTYEMQPPTPTSPLDLRMFKRDYTVQGMPCIMTEL